ncbi:MAG: DEAD/DEAH box helicase [bacterium]
MASKDMDGKFRKRSPEEKKATTSFEGTAKAQKGKKKKPAKKKSSKKKTATKTRTPRTRKPSNMTVEEWQIALRREFSEVQEFKMKNIGEEPIFSEFLVENPETGGAYKVAIRGEGPGINYCSCPDFAVNTLGTCKHIEFVLARLRKKRGAKKAFREGHQSPYSSVYLRYGAQRKVMFKPGIECPATLKDLAGRYFDKEGVLTPEGFSRFDEFMKKAGKIKHELRCYEDALQYIAHIRDSNHLRERVDKAYPRGGQGTELKSLLKVPMYSYQRKGALFAARQGRSIIADDMGLGKTIQAIAACEILARLAGIERVLVVCPASLKHQWQTEIERFTDRSAMVIEGGLAARERLYETESFYKLCNYELIYRDRDFIKQWSPDMIILDEAQRIKNWKTRTAQSVKQLESPYAIVLTGTPLENRLEELHSIVEFVDRFHLGPRFRFLHEHQVTDEFGKVVGYKNLSRISETLSPILIRRTKDEVLKELPERLEKKYFVGMTPEQMKHHEENKETVGRIVAKWRRYGFLSETDQRVLLTALQFMRMSCNSTYLLDKRTDHGYKADELMGLLSDIFEDPKAKVVVFSQWLGTHELIIRRLEENGWDYAFLHGGVPSKKRKDLIQRFRDNKNCRLFLSTEAGGLGMNLQNASAVINMDMPWNPAVLDQRIGRVHRLGQHQPVRVVNFVADHTIEHGMLSLLSFKKSLFSGVLDGGQDEVFLGGSRLKRFMETVEKATGSIPEGPAVPAELPPSAQQAAEEELATEEKKPAAAASPAEQAWAEVASAGLAFLDKLGQAMNEQNQPGPQQESKTDSPLGFAQGFVEQDEAGRSFFKLPMPEPETLKKFADLLYKVSGT